MSNLEDLNKHQLILLTLLVAFVTSIATGIITYTLLQEAPVEVTQTINRVVERTIEKVVPAEGGAPGEVVREIQVVNEENLILESIEKNAKSIVRVKTAGFDGVEILSGLGLVVSSEVVVMDERNFSQNATYSVHFHDGKIFDVIKSYENSGFVFMKICKSLNDNYNLESAVLGNPNSLKLGQTIIAVGGKTSNSVAIGRVAQLGEEILSDIPKSRSQVGSPLLNLNGEIMGMEAASLEADTTLSYTSINTVKELLAEALKALSQ